MESARVEAFSDGVFAVAITLLALDLTVAGPGHGSLAHQLADHWPSYFAYALSFFTIGITWVNHHALFNGFAKGDRTLLFLNMTLLMFVVAIPFTTATMAAYLRSGGADSHLAAALYGVVLEGVGLSFAAIFLWSIRGDRRREPLPADARRTALLRFGLGSSSTLSHRDRVRECGSRGGPDCRRCRVLRLRANSEQRRRSRFRLNRQRAARPQATPSCRPRLVKISRVALERLSV